MTEDADPANVSPFVNAIGTELTLALILAAGGSQLYLPRRSGKNTLAAKTIGVENVERLAAALGHGYIKVPVARRWAAQTLRDQGKSDNEIARLVRADVATVRRWRGPNTDEQLALPL